ncbi:TOBE domain-containing protein [Siccirubricoccus phaeus]|uniref:TOBE domain-containing protein n=1 Tax=Siccirubricoccus phaeus TaxID=2595053 RepID=UPI0011F1DD3D|nr:TOBE domain-containing protein [Siccirubricoccus phaeus]
MQDTAPVLEVEGLGLPGAGLRALDLRLGAGEVVALLGAGAGAVLAVLAGQARAAAGRVRLPGGPPGLLPPPAALFRNRTVLENLAPGLAGWPAAERPARAARLLARTGLEGQEGKRPPQLSPAQQLRLCLARALAPGPALLLLDDPLAGLDPGPRRALALEWRSLFRRLGQAVLLTTPEGAEAMALAGRLLVLEAGEVVQEGPPQALYDAPATAFVAGLIGENNRLPGTVLALEEDMARVRLDCGPELEARLADAGGPGSRCIVAVRPEKVAVAAMSAEELGEGALPASLQEVVFLGPEVRLVLGVGEGGVLVARRPPGGRLPRVGGPAAVAWDAYAAFAYRETPMILSP